ncbi:MAG: alpha/beta fold hydrolase [Hyphomicrobiaceae bacterium]
MLTDGRVLTYRQFGTLDGFPVLALHGTPGSRLKYAMADAAAATLGLRIVSPDRWGYGGSDPHPRPTLARYAADIAELVRGLGLARFSILGVSGGAPYAAAVAAECTGQAAALALVSPVGPIAGTPAERALDPFHRFCFRVVPFVPGGVRLAFSIFRGVLAFSTPAALRLAGIRAGRADRLLACDDDVCRRLGATFRTGLRRGAGGPVIDMRLFGGPWNISLARISAPARIWFGSEDRHVPWPAVQELAHNISSATLSRLDGHGHLWISRHCPEVLSWLAEAGNPKT